MSKVRDLMKNKKVCSLYILLAIFIVVSVSIVKYRGGEVNYLNSDATWHTLLTMESYDETSISQHKFLPIVSLGNEDDKYISWGATISDDKGNYYYTSFSPAGYVLPYLFTKLFHLPINEKSLYVFNVLLFILSAILWISLLNRVYANCENRNVVMLIGLMSYIFSPELFHGMGIVYWHQSLMQVTLLIQILSYYIWKNEDSNKAKIVFMVMTVANPYIEWTGYVANVGFAFAELILNWKIECKKGCKNAITVGLLTILSFELFTLHYLSVVSEEDFFTVLESRFFARNFASSTLLTDVFGGYLKSFLLLWVLLIFLVVWNAIKNEKIDFRNKILIFVMIFPLLENMIMKEHALSYTYDRMKMIFILSFIISDLSDQILLFYKQKKKIVILVLCVFTIVCCVGNLKYYMNDERYIWETDYRSNNKEIAEYISENYSDSVLVTNTAVRGYLNLLFNKGIYEGRNIDSAILLASEKGKTYAIEINIGENTSWNMYQLSGATVYNTMTNEYEQIEIRSDGTISKGSNLGMSIH